MHCVYLALSTCKVLCGSFCIDYIDSFVRSFRLLPRETGGSTEGMITPQRRHCALDSTIQRCLFLWLFLGYGELEKKRERRRQRHRHRDRDRQTDRDREPRTHNFISQGLRF